MTWVIFDFAGVIGQHQPQKDQEAMVAAAGTASPDSFWAEYWSHREGYDAGRVSAVDYWERVLAGSAGKVSPEGITALIKLDVASWLHPDLGTVELLTNLAEQEVSMALLSNCPVELAAALETLPWLESMSRRFYSSHLRLVKPDPKVYMTAAGKLNADTQDCVFVDDRQANVEAAERVGMHGIVFSDATMLRSRLAELLSPGRPGAHR
jgi:putative hydrolase of the HAD superfamily